MIELRFENLRSDRPVLATQWDLLLGIVAEFSIVIDERYLYYEEEFPVVEFAARLDEWLRCLGEEDSKRDFVYESMESEEPCLIYFRRAKGGWQLGCRFQRYDEPREFDCQEVVDRSKEFIRSLKTETRTRLGVDIEPAIGAAAKRDNE